MRRVAHLAFSILAATMFFKSPALANICRAETLTCATTMPVGGYCECTSRGTTEDGTVVTGRQPGHPVNSTAGGCGSQPNAPGCRR